MNDAEALHFLQRHEGQVTDVAPLTGGYWSTAYAYTVDAQERVVRFSPLRDGFEADAAAMSYAGPDLPVPTVLEVGTTPDGIHYAISVRHHGRFLEDVRPDEAERAGPTLRRLLDALRRIPVEPQPTWHEWLRACLRDDDPSAATHGWRKTLEVEHPDIAKLHDAATAEIERLIDACPTETSHMVHGDLLHQNVLVDDDATHVTAVFSWKCAEPGDHLYDLAWCTFWSAWHPGIAAIDLASPDDDEPDAGVRHHLYELHIGARHLGWHAHTGDAAELHRVANETRRILERGPR